MRMTTVIAGVLAVCLAGAVPAAARDTVYSLPRTTVTATVAKDGSVGVVEEHTFHFSADGHGAYVDLPVTYRSRIEDVTVSEGGLAYREEGTAELGVDRPAATFAQRDCGGVHRVVWYFAATGGSDRVFRIAYRLRGAVIAYDDHAFLHLPVWGRNWDPSLDRLEVSVRLPRVGKKKETYAAFGRPGELLQPAFAKQTVSATATNVPGGRSAALDVAFPRKQLALTLDTAEDVRKGSGAANLRTLGSGSLVSTDSGTGCPATLTSSSASSSSGGVLSVLGPILASVALLTLLIIFRSAGTGGGSRYRRHHQTGFSSSSGGDSSSSSSSFSGSGGGGDGGGGGGAW
ncbi:DUF2207 domain-containing protein [Nonomuraea sediminis]|uniref:DUF2207 domain-containing protein n=1 Tax=Nonomuraea sediminis TaxID=2835864 RepID=UPI001BDC653D|nr:DUF2207 domain-containing protein [Nonomuraea sediminis]